MRLALLLGAAAVLAAYTVSHAAGRTPVESARYLSCLAVATPALLWPLWRAAGRRRAAGLASTAAAPVGSGRGGGPRIAASGGRGDAARGDAARGDAARGDAARGGVARVVAGVVAGVVLAGALGTAGAATAGVIARVPAVHAEADRHRALVDVLGALGVRHVRGDYWTCNRLTFATGENIVCAVVDETLRPGFDRLPAYRRAVAADPAAAWVAPAGSPLAARLDARLGRERGELDLVEVAGWRIYRPRR